MLQTVQNLIYKVIHLAIPSPSRQKIPWLTFMNLDPRVDRNKENVVTKLDCPLLHKSTGFAKDTHGTMGIEIKSLSPNLTY